jgi:hypothetical protein
MIAITSALLILAALLPTQTTASDSPQQQFMTIYQLSQATYSAASSSDQSEPFFPPGCYPAKLMSQADLKSAGSFLTQNGVEKAWIGSWMDVDPGRRLFTLSGKGNISLVTGNQSERHPVLCQVKVPLVKSFASKDLSKNEKTAGPVQPRKKSPRTIPSQKDLLSKITIIEDNVLEACKRRQPVGTVEPATEETKEEQTEQTEENGKQEDAPPVQLQRDCAHLCKECVAKNGSCLYCTIKTGCICAHVVTD